MTPLKFFLHCQVFWKSISMGDAGELSTNTSVSSWVVRPQCYGGKISDPRNLQRRPGNPVLYVNLDPLAGRRTLHRGEHDALIVGASRGLQGQGLSFLRSHVRHQLPAPLISLSTLEITSVESARSRRQARSKPYTVGRTADGRTEVFKACPAWTCPLDPIKPPTNSGVVPDQYYRPAWTFTTNCQKCDCARHFALPVALDEKRTHSEHPRRTALISARHLLVFAIPLYFSSRSRLVLCLRKL